MCLRFYSTLLFSFVLLSTYSLAADGNSGKSRHRKKLSCGRTLAASDADWGIPRLSEVLQKKLPPEVRLLHALFGEEDEAEHNFVLVFSGNAENILEPELHAQAPLIFPL